MSLITLGIEDYILTEIVELEGSQKSSNTTEQKVTDNNVKSAIIQLVPDDIYHVVESLPTAFEMWNAIRLYYQPNAAATLETLLEEFWGLKMAEDVDIDELANELTRRQTQIASIDPLRKPFDSSKRSLLLKHFEKIGNGFYGGSVSYLKINTNVTFLQTVNLLRDSQKNYREEYANSAVNIIKDGITSSSKRCAFCNRTNHTRETCFEWIATPEGSKWASKNPQKAAKVERVKLKFGRIPRIGGDKSYDEDIFI